MLIADRIKLIRKKCNLTQAQFAKKLNLTRANIASIEVGRINVTNRVRYDICDTFNINEDWLKSGIGSMFVEKDRNEVIIEWSAKLVKSTGNSFPKRLATMLAQLDENEWAVLEKMAKTLFEDKKNGQD